MHAWYRAVVFAVAAALSACSKEAPAPAQPVQPAQVAVSAAAVDGPASLEDGLRGVAEIDALRPALRKVQGRLEAAGVAFEAYFEGPVLRCVEEQTPSAGTGRGAKAYYLDATGVLFYHHAEYDGAVAAGSGSGTGSVSIRIAFDPAGNVRASEKTLDGRPAPLLEADVREALARLGALRKAADAAGRTGEAAAGRSNGR